MAFSSPWSILEARHYRGTTLTGVTLWERRPSTWKHGKAPFVVLSEP